MAKRFEMMKAQAEVLTKMDNLLDEIIRDKTMDYRVVGKEEEQAKDWRTGELKWEDDEKTIPYFKDKWDYVAKDEDEISEEDRIMIEVCKAFSKKLDKLI